MSKKVLNKIGSMFPLGKISVMFENLFPALTWDIYFLQTFLHLRSQAGVNIYAGNCNLFTESDFLGQKLVDSTMKGTPYITVRDTTYIHKKCVPVHVVHWPAKYEGTDEAIMSLKSFIVDIVP